MAKPSLLSSFAALTLVLPSLVACDDPGADTQDQGDTDDDDDDDNDDAQRFDACEDTFTITDPDPMYPWTPNAITLESHELAPGVFAVYDSLAAEYGPAGIPLATSGGFVIGDDGVLLVETMINRQLLCQMVDLVRAQTDAPILYAINTSYHGDHSFGNAYLPDEVEIVQHERTASHIAAHFDDDIAFMEAGFGGDQGIAEAFPVDADVLVGDDGWSVDLGDVVVEAQYYGFAQTEGDLFVYVPAAGVLWTGNPLIAEAPALPWLLDGHAVDVGVTLAAVQAAMPPGTIIVPGHSHPLELTGFDFAIEYLATLVTEVQAAVDADLDVEQTVATVTMEPFQGYALWDWIHSGVNVPATHAELDG